MEKKMKGSPMTLAQAIQTAIAALQSVLSEDFKPSEIEVPGSLLHTFCNSAFHPACSNEGCSALTGHSNPSLLGIACQPARCLHACSAHRSNACTMASKAGLIIVLNCLHVYRSELFTVETGVPFACLVMSMLRSI